MIVLVPAFEPTRHLLDLLNEAHGLPAQSLIEPLVILFVQFADAVVELEFLDLNEHLLLAQKQFCEPVIFHQHGCWAFLEQRPHDGNDRNYGKQQSDQNSCPQHECILMWPRRQATQH